MTSFFSLKLIPLRRFFFLIISFSYFTYTYPLINELTVNKIVITPSGEEEIIEDIENINPNDIIEYSFYIENDSLFSIYYLKPTIPIPPLTTLILTSVSPTDFKVSLDNTNFIELPLDDIESIDIPESAYKKVQWYVEEVPSKESLTLKLRVRVDQ